MFRFAAGHSYFLSGCLGLQLIRNYWHKLIYTEWLNCLGLSQAKLSKHASTTSLLAKPIGILQNMFGKDLRYRIVHLLCMKWMGLFTKQLSMKCGVGFNLSRYYQTETERLIIHSLDQGSSVQHKFFSLWNVEQYFFAFFLLSGCYSSDFLWSKFEYYCNRIYAPFLCFWSNCFKERTFDPASAV